MGQKTEFKLEDWDFPEEKTKTSDVSDKSISININDEMSMPEHDIEPLLEGLEADLSDAQEPKLSISHQFSEKREDMTQEELAFRRQIEDLFELLEMEKAADKKDGVRVYQTDSSPSRPWRFH